ncbi:sulfurtransferase TusA family protein [Psychromarinibacter sp. C21-152]|uniref:Sulfurtransferase TusA family protein n=1 Tax=Psychromarinibacter sediminicola TaxID=3033385 RepID=A0AAE3NXB3_9RHOB|nr:sulfurtransferase TusA family protein [Psychromarinibacter sediminicola]MDF0602357.1 sulfurtransferase TusA family protein [Psychromarinibacter sediminicola]
MTPDEEIDARGLICPLPVLRLRKVLQGLADGAVVRMLADDPVAVVDVPHFCAEQGHALIASEPAGDAQRYVVRKGG